MKFTVLQKLEYKKYSICIMQFHTVFQYIFCDREGNIYMDHLNLKPTNYRAFLAYLGWIKNKYKQDEIDFGREMCLSAAIKSIDAIIEKGPETEIVLPKRAQRENTECTWRAVVTEDKQHAWQCIIHSVIVPMVDGEKPYHYEDEVNNGEATKDQNQL